MELRGAVTVITGASAGIGEATALAFAARGARTVLAARRLDRLEALAVRIRSAGGDAVPVRCDVTRPEDLSALVRETEDAFGRAEVLVNNAGIPGGGPFPDAPAELLARVLRTNLEAVVLATKAFLPLLLRDGGGHVVNVASLAGRHPVPGAAVYSATKHGVAAFSEALYHELGPHGVLVTSVDPGLVATEGFPMTGVDRRLVMAPERVARAIVRSVERSRGPRVSVPRGSYAAELVRVLAPGPYRWGVRTAIRRFSR